MSIAYVFVHMMPELHIVRRAFTASISIRLRYEGMATHFLALLGFLAFYGLDHLHARRREMAVDGLATPDFRFYVGGFTTYVLLMRSLLIDNLRESNTSTASYAMAMSLHSLAVEHEFLHEYGAVYDRVGMRVLVGMSVARWAEGMVAGLPHSALALVGGFLLEYDHYELYHSELYSYGTSI